MPGAFILPDRIPIGQAIDEELLLSEMSDPGEWMNQVVYLPL